jgi:hypothetical protein
MTVVCRAGDGGEVRFPMAAIDSYDTDQAARFAATHDVGTMARIAYASDSSSDEAVSSAGSATSDCDSSYEGACLDPDATDYDCEGGSGDGPEYTGVVTVVGDDHFGLDRNGDGLACDS